MAEKRTIDINIKNNADEATKDFNTFNKALDETAKSAKNVNSTFEEVYGELQPLTTRLGEAEDRLYELALAGDTTSKEYQELLTKVGEYRKVQIQTDLAVDGAAQTMTSKLGSALNGVTSGFAATQGAMALFGSENEALEKSLLKVQSALAIQQGVKGLSDAYKELSIGTKLATAAKAAYATVTGTTTGLLKAFRIALASTGIGLLVVAVGALIANFDKLTSVFKPVINSLKAVGDAIGLTNFASDERAEKLKKQRELEAELAEEELKAHNARMDQMRAEQAEQDALISKEIELAEARGEDTTEMQRAQLEKRLSDLKGNLAEEEKAYQDAEGDMVEYYKKNVSEAQQAMAFLQKQGADDIYQLSFEQKQAFQETFSFSIATSQKELQRQIESNTKSLEFQAETVRQRFGKTTQAQLDQAQKDIEIFNARTTASEKAEQKKKLENYKRYLQDRLNARRKIEDIENSMMEDGIDKELKLNEVKFRRLREDAEKNTKLTSDERKKLLALFTEQEEKAVAEIRKKYYDEEKAQAQELIDFNEELRLKQIEDNKAKNLAILQANKEAYEKQKALDEKAAKEKAERQQAQIDLAVQGLQLVAGFAELFAGDDEKRQKKAFQIKKAADIAAATVDGYRAVLSTYAQTPGGPVLKGIAAGIAGGFASLQIANIASQQFEGGGSTGGGSDFSGGGVGGGEVAPQFNVVGDSSVNQLAQLQQTPTQAYVVSGEVTSAQALDRNRVTNATL